MGADIQDAFLYLADGMVLQGQSFGADLWNGGECIFQTGMSGYEEVLSDPSYRGQILVMTSAEIGNYGVSDRFMESSRYHVQGLVVTSYNSPPGLPSLSDKLRAQGVPAVAGIDTRLLTQCIRQQGALKAVLGSGPKDVARAKQLMADTPDMAGLDLVSGHETPDRLGLGSGQGPYGVLVDFGVKESILNCFLDRGCRMDVLSARRGPQAFLDPKYDFIVLSNGPGDPAVLKHFVEMVSSMIGKKPMLGICLGHQLLTLACGGKTQKLPYGHHGCNHPVKCLKTDRILVTSQNHGFVGDIESLESGAHKLGLSFQPRYVHVSDGTLEGFSLPKEKVLSVQFHPEAGPGPHDGRYIFDEFLKEVVL